MSARRTPLASLLADVREWKRTHRETRGAAGSPEVEARALQSAKTLLGEMDGVRATVIEHAEERYRLSMQAMERARNQLVTFDDQSQGALESTRSARRRAELALLRADERQLGSEIREPLAARLAELLRLEIREAAARGEARKPIEGHYRLAESAVVETGSALLAVLREQLPKLEVMVDLAEIHSREAGEADDEIPWPPLSGPTLTLVDAEQALPPAEGTAYPSPDLDERDLHRERPRRPGAQS